jgi:RimJ/RimL family protein N-acetyltransferase
MKPKITIRLCKKSDLSKIMRLTKNWTCEFKGGPARGENWFTTKHAAKILRENPKTCWVLEIEGKIAGFRFVDNDSDGRAWGWTIFIAKPFRQAGYGTLLFKETLKALKKLGFRKLYAECDFDNRRVIAWHKKMGYARIGTFPDWFGPDAHAAVFAMDLKQHK